MKKQVVLTQTQKDIILVGLKSIMETFRVMGSNERTEYSDDYFIKVTTELVETYKSFIKYLPSHWRNMDKPEAPGYIATAYRCQKNLNTLEKLQLDLLNKKLFNTAHTIAPEVILYNVWGNHTWAFKCFVGLASVAPRIMSQEEYDQKYLPITRSLYNKFSKEESNE